MSTRSSGPCRGRASATSASIGVGSRDAIRPRARDSASANRASLKGFEWAFANRDDAIAIEKKLEPDMNVAQQRRVLDLVADRVHTPNSEGEPLGYMAPEDWQESVDLMTEYLGLDDSKLPEGVEGLYTNEFIQDGQP